MLLLLTIAKLEICKRESLRQRRTPLQKDKCGDEPSVRVGLFWFAASVALTWCDATMLLELGLSKHWGQVVPDSPEVRLARETDVK